MRARLATARLAFHVDINVGDPVDPPPRLTELPTLLGTDAPRVWAYPAEMVIAEKLVTAFERGRHCFEIWKIGPPHQRAIAEDPMVRHASAARRSA